MAESAVVPILDLRDEFGTCEICLEDYDSKAKSPRILPCFHTFCCGCLESIWNTSSEGIKCPNCRSLWPVQETILDTFPQNKIVMNVVEYIILKNKPEQIMCHQCPSCSKATLRCLDCREYMCEVCATYHRKFAFSQQHTILLISQFIKMSQAEIFQQKDVCEQHENMTLDLFCNTCTTIVCSSCVFTSHMTHKICDLKDVYEAKKEELRSILSSLCTSTDTSQAYNSRLTEQNKTLGAMQQKLLQDVDDSCDKAMEKLSNKRKQLKEDVISNVDNQRADREKQIGLVVQRISDNSQHYLYCQQALSFARAVDFMKMSQALEDKTKRLLEIPELVDMPINEIQVDIETVGQICSLMDAVTPSFTYGMSQIKTCIDVTDVMLGETSTMLTPTLLTKEKEHKDQPKVVQATTQTPTDKRHKVKLNMLALSLGVGRFVYRSQCIGSHGMSISFHGHQLTNDKIIFHCRDMYEDLRRTVHFSIDGERGDYKELSLPTVEFDKSRLNCDECLITKDGHLTNQLLGNDNNDDDDDDDEEEEEDGGGDDDDDDDYDDEEEEEDGGDDDDDCDDDDDDDDDDDGIMDPVCRHTCLFGTTARRIIVESGCGYWQLEIDCKVLESAEIGCIAAQAGICFQEQSDTEIQISNMKDSWGVSVNSCKYHNKQCLKVYSRNICVYDRALASFTPNTALNLKLGLMLDIDKQILHVIRVDTEKLVHSIPHIDVSQPLMPVFGVYNHADFDVKLKIISGRELLLDRGLLLLLSKLIH